VTLYAVSDQVLGTKRHVLGSSLRGSVPLRHTAIVSWMSAVAAPSSRRALTLALALYLLWVLATYLLEGRVFTFRRPEATGARLIYALVANILIGTIGSTLVIRYLSRTGEISAQQAGFRGLGHAAVAVAVGVALGFAFYALRGAPSLDPMVILNAYAQVLVVTVAEVLVCWAVVGSLVESLLRDDRGRWVSVIVAAIIASVLFGVYHFAHSPPFNTVGLVVLLTVIGLVTSVFFFVSKDVYGTIAFHNFLGIIGVIQALDASGNLASFARPVIPLLAMAVVAIAVLITVHMLWLKVGATPSAPRVR
jgi:hypothetical protein